MPLLTQAQATAVHAAAKILSEMGVHTTIGIHLDNDGPPADRRMVLVEACHAPSAYDISKVRSTLTNNFETHHSPEMIAQVYGL